MTTSRAKVEDFERGNTVTIDATFSDDTGAVVQPDNKEAFITIEDLDTGTVVIGADATMTNVSDTQYRYQWDTTSGANLGEYSIEVNAEVSNNDVLNRDRIKLEDIITED